MKRVLVAEEAVQTQATAELIANATVDVKIATTGEYPLVGHRILVVDDDIRNLLATASTLEKNGAEVKTARSGIAALKKLKDCQQIDLVVLDIVTPGIAGALQEIRRQPGSHPLPIIALTPCPQRDDQRWLRAGVNDCIAKPIDGERLISLIGLWLPKVG